MMRPLQLAAIFIYILYWVRHTESIKFRHLFQLAKQIHQIDSLIFDKIPQCQPDRDLYGRIYGPDKNQHILIAGAGPDGLHMAYELNSRGYTNITIIDSQNTAGGDTCLITPVRDQQGEYFYNLGTNFIVNSRKNKTAAKFYEMMETMRIPFKVIPMPIPKVRKYSAENEPYENSTSFIQHTMSYLNALWPGRKKRELLSDFYECVRAYIEKHQETFGRYEYFIPPKPQKDILSRELNMTIDQYIEAFNLQPLRPVFEVYFEGLGFGKLTEMSALHGLLVITPEFLSDIAIQQLRMESFHLILFTQECRKVWDTVAAYLLKRGVRLIFGARLEGIYHLCNETEREHIFEARFTREARIYESLREEEIEGKLGTASAEWNDLHYNETSPFKHLFESNRVSMVIKKKRNRYRKGNRKEWRKFKSMMRKMLKSVRKMRKRSFVTTYEETLFSLNQYRSQMKSEFEAAYIEDRVGYHFNVTYENPVEEYLQFDWLIWSHSLTYANSIISNFRTYYPTYYSAHLEETWRYTFSGLFSLMIDENYENIDFKGWLIYDTTNVDIAFSSLSENVKIVLNEDGEFQRFVFNIKLTSKIQMTDDEAIDFILKAFRPYHPRLVNEANGNEAVAYITANHCYYSSSFMTSGVVWDLIQEQGRVNTWFLKTGASGMDDISSSVSFNMLLLDYMRVNH